MIRYKKLTKSERLAARRELGKKTLTLSNPEDVRDFELGETIPFDLTNPDVCKFLFGQFWEDCMSVPGSPEAVHTLRITSVDVETGVIKCVSI